MKNRTIDQVNLDLLENTVLKKLEEEYPIMDLLSFNEFNIGDKLKDNAFLVEKFRLMNIHERSKLQKLDLKLSELTGKMYNYYKYEDPKDLTKVEIEKYYLTTDPAIKKLKMLYQLQEIRCSYFEALVEAFKTQGFNIRNFLENLKIGG